MGRIPKALQVSVIPTISAIPVTSVTFRVLEIPEAQPASGTPETLETHLISLMSAALLILRELEDLVIPTISEILVISATFKVLETPEEQLAFVIPVTSEIHQTSLMSAALLILRELEDLVIPTTFVTPVTSET